MDLLFNTEISFLDLMTYYNFIISKKLLNRPKLVKKIVSQEISNSNIDYDISYNQDQKYFFNKEIGTGVLIENENIMEYLNINSYIFNQEKLKSNIKNFYGWHFFDNKQLTDVFIGFDNNKIFGCFIVSNSSKENTADDLINSSCINLLKFIFWK